MDYDLSGTGQTVPIAVRGTKALTNNLSLEFGGTYATPEQQFGGRSSFLAPEVRLTYSWGKGRFRPSSAAPAALPWFDRTSSTLAGGSR